MQRNTLLTFNALLPAPLTGTAFAAEGQTKSQAGMGVMDAPVERITVYPDRDDTMLLNPGKGWVQYYGSDKYAKDYIGIGYTRWAWSVLEPKEGQYNWREIDGFISQFKRHGKRTAFGVMSVSTVLDQYVTPKWVFDAEAVDVVNRDINRAAIEMTMTCGKARSAMTIRAYG
jgi:hypothetical protein